MKNLISNQLYITTFNYPMNSVKTLLFKNQTFDSLYKNKEFSIKMFIGSDWSIVGSGFSFFGPNDLKIVYIVSGIEIDDFETINKFSITYINMMKQLKNNINSLKTKEKPRKFHMPQEVLKKVSISKKIQSR